MKSELEKFIDNNHEAFDTRMPDPAVLERIQQQMAGIPSKEKKEEKAIVVPVRMVKWAVAACCILLAGAAIFFLQKEPAKENLANVTTEKTVKDAPAAATTNQPANQQTAAVQPDENKLPAAVLPKRNYAVEIEEENNVRKQVIFAKLNNMESPSQRLTAASQAYQLKNTDNDIVDALVKTMNTDPSTNVRLAALDALGKFYRETYVKKKLVESLKKQNDPMVQIGLIDLLTKMKERTILKELDKIVKDGNSMDAVKDHAYSGILTLRS